MRRAAIYARFSTDLQRDRSIDDQVALCRDYAARERLTVVETYADRARTSASIIGREGILRLMEDARAGRFEVVIVEALDRISRDQEDLAGIYKRLSFAQVDLVAVHDGQANAVQIGIRGLVGELFLADLKHKVRRGMSGVVRDGRHPGGQAYGYRPKPGAAGELVIDETEADVVRRIFERYAAGIPPRAIAGELNAEGIPSPRGGVWNASTINGNPARGYGILRNPLYRGLIVWNRVRMVRDPDTGRRVSRTNPESEWQTADAPDLAIVPAELFSAAEARHATQSRARASGRSTKRALRPLSGLLRCGCCGAGMSIHSKRKGSIWIMCSRAKESGACSCRQTARLDRIEAAVFGELRRHLEHPECLKEFVHAYREERRRLADTTSRDRRRLERRAEKALATFDRLVDMYASGVVDGPEAAQRVRDAQTRMRETRAELEAAAAEPIAVELHPAAVTAYAAAIDDLSAALQDTDGTFDQTAIAALRKVVKELVVHRTGTGATTVEIRGTLTALLGDPDAESWGEVVAEDRVVLRPAVIALVEVA